MRHRLPLSLSDMDTLLALLDTQPATTDLIAFTRGRDVGCINSTLLKLTRRGFVSRRKPGDEEGFGKSSAGRWAYLYELNGKGKAVAEALAVVVRAIEEHRPGIVDAARLPT